MRIAYLDRKLEEFDRRWIQVVAPMWIVECGGLDDGTHHSDLLRLHPINDISRFLYPGCVGQHNGECQILGRKPYLEVGGFGRRDRLGARAMRNCKRWRSIHRRSLIR